MVKTLAQLELHILYARQTLTALQYKPQWQWRAYSTHFSGQKPLSASHSNQGPVERGAKPHQEKEMGNTFAFATICSTEVISSPIAKNVHLQT